VSVRTAEERARELARDLTPVRPIPALRWVLGASVALGLVAPFAAHGLLGGPGIRPGGIAPASLPYLTTLAGLVGVAVAALGAALATAVPGREHSARLAARLALGAGALAVAGGVFGIVAGEGLAEGERISDCLSCIGRSLTLGAGPVLLAAGFIVYAAVRRPASGTAWALAGGVALGAAAVHASCPSESPLHWLLAHTLAPVAAVALLTVPVAALLARRTRRS